MPVYFETYQTVIQSISITDFSFGFTESSFLLLNGQTHLMSLAEDLTSNKQKRTKRIYESKRCLVCLRGFLRTEKYVRLNEWKTGSSVC